MKPMSNWKVFERSECPITSSCENSLAWSARQTKSSIFFSRCLQAFQVSMGARPLSFLSKLSAEACVPAHFKAVKLEDVKLEEVDLVQPNDGDESGWFPTCYGRSSMNFTWMRFETIIRTQCLKPRFHIQFTENNWNKLECWAHF